MRLHSHLLTVLLIIFAAHGAVAQPAEFTAPERYEIGGTAYHVEAVDLDGDGHLDLVASSHAADGITVLINDGSGAFGDPIERFVTNGTRGLATGDFDGDGLPDVVAAANISEVIFLPGNGDGTFGEPRSHHEPSFGGNAFELAAADFDQDGRLDVAALGNGQVIILAGDGEGGFELMDAFAADDGAVNKAGFTAADLNGDGWTDLAVGTGGGEVVIMLNDGTGALFEAERITTSTDAYDVAAADFDGDGHMDLAASGFSVAAILINQNNEAFEAGPLVSTAGIAWNLAAADLNLDGNADLALVTNSEAIQVRYGNGDGTFETSPNLAMPLITSYGIVAADLSGDGRTDLVATDASVLEGGLAVRLNTTVIQPAAEALLLSPAGEEPGEEEYITRRRSGVANIPRLAEMAAASEGELLLNFFDDVERTARLTEAVWRSETAFTWYGRFPDFEQDHVVIVVDLARETVTGNATIHGRLYQIRPLGGGLHETREIDQSAFPEIEDFTPPPDENFGKAGGGPAVQRSVTDAADSHPVIDLLIVYTSNAASFSNDILSEIQLAVDETNVGFSQSGVEAEVRLVGVEQVDDGESTDQGQNRDRLQDPEDGFFDEVHDIRANVGADIVGLIVEFGSGCGIAYIMEEVNVSFRDWAFFVVRRSCATGNYSFGHEIGHIMGARHDRFVDDTDDSPFPYNHGYVDIDDGWRTVMSYPDACDCSDEDGTEPDTCPARSARATPSSPWCDRVLYWSDPTSTYDHPGNNDGGGAMGIASGSEAADNVRTLNNTAATVAAFMDVDVRHISGFVLHRDTGGGLEGVDLNGFPVTTTTDEEGYYEAFVTDAWSGTVTPAFDLYTFDPQEVTFTSVSSNLQQDFTAIPPHVIAGKIIELDTSDPVVGIRLLGFPPAAGIVQTDAVGEYEAEVPVGWSGIVRPTSDIFHFAPETREYVDVRSDIADHNYIVTAVVLADSDWPLFGRNPARTASGLGSPIGPSVKWSVELTDGSFHSPVVGPEGTVYVVSTTGRVYAFGPDGSELWTLDGSPFESSTAPAVGAGGVVYVVQSNSSSDPRSRVIAVEADGGGIKWSTPFSDNITSAPNLGESGALYVGTESGELVALNVRTGSERWRFATGSAEPILSSAALDENETIYFGSMDRHVYAVNPDGTEKWRHNVFGEVESSPAIGSDGTVFVGTNGLLLWAINPDGTFKWVFPARGQIRSSPAVGPNGNIFVGSDDGYLYAVKPDGSQLWRYKTAESVASSPAVTTHRSVFDGFFPAVEQTETVVYVGSNDGKVYAVNAGGTFSLSTPGTKRWAYDTGSPVESSPAISFEDNTLYISAGNGLYALGDEPVAGSGSIQFTSLATTIDPELLDLRDNIHIIITFEGAEGFGEVAIIGGLPDDPCQGGPLFVPDCTDLASGFGTVSPLVDLPAGTMLRAGIVDAGTGEDVLGGDLTGLISTFEFALQPGETYQGIIAGASHPELLVANPGGHSTLLSVFQAPNEVPTGEGIAVYAGHFSTDVGQVEITLHGKTVHTFETLEYGEFSDPTLLQAGEYVAEVAILEQGFGKAASDAGSRIFFPFSVTGAGDGLRGILLAGFLNPDANLGGPSLSVEQSGLSGAVAASARGQALAARDRVLALLEVIPKTKGRNSPRKPLEEALAHIDESLKPKRWLDDRHVHPDDGEDVFDEAKDAVRELLKFVDGGSEWTQEALLAVRHLVVAAQVIADTAIDDAGRDCESAGCRKELDKATAAWSEAQSLLAAEQYEAAVPKYARAWEAALEALAESGAVAFDNGNGQEDPRKFAVERNYPNPFNPRTSIAYSLPDEIDVRVEVFDPLGRRVALLVDEVQPAGRHEVIFDSGGLASGVYLYRVTAGAFVETRSMALLK